MIDNERETKKYKDAVELAITLESKERFGKTLSEIMEMEPKWLYTFLEDEWWRRWNGLRQEWENPE